jgi:hypothetical protein
MVGAVKRASLALLVALTACGKGCDAELPLPAPPPATQPQAPAAARHPAAAVERAHGLALPERKSGTVWPALHQLPYRKLSDFQPERHLMLALKRDGGQILGQRFDPSTDDDARLLADLRQGHDDWQRRAGVAANRLVLAVDATVPPEVAGRVRRLASEASQWRVVALARDGEVLVEVLLDPPPEQRPTP